MHLPFTRKHVQLISACYPPQSSAPNPVPNPRELSHLLHYVFNNPGKVSKFAAELDRRVKLEVRRGQAGNVRARTTLLVTLSIYRSLVNECQGDNSLFSAAALISSVNTALKALPSDIEVATKAASAIVTALVVTIFKVDIPELQYFATSLKDPSTHISYESRSRQANGRRAVSTNLSKGDEQELSLPDVAISALSTLRTMMTQSNRAQIRSIMQAVFDSLDKTNSWGKIDHCRWLAQVGVEWAQYPYRYAVPTLLIERLLETSDFTSRPVHTALTSMIITVFTSTTPLVNISTSDVVSNLASLIIRRAAVNPDDPLLPALVESVGSLGTHVYYADQIQDLGIELISRLMAIETRVGPGVCSEGRAQAIRGLLAGLLGLIQAADAQSAKDTDEIDDSKTPDISAALSNRKGEAKCGHKRVHPSRRTKISPEAWHDTLTLLCDGDYAIRADYAHALVSYIGSEIAREGNHPGPDGTRRRANTTEGVAKQTKTATSIMYGNSVMGFLNALHACVSTLATTTSLGIGTGVQNNIPTTSTLSQNRHTAGTKRLLDWLSAGPQSENSSSANLSDYGHVMNILVAVHEHLPISALVAGVPMLLALDNVSKEYREREPQRYNALQEVLARVWLTLGKIWDCALVLEEAAKALTDFTPPSSLVTRVASKPGVLLPPQTAQEFKEGGEYVPCRGINSAKLLAALVASSNMQGVTGLDSSGLQVRLSKKWTAESALKDTLEVQASPFTSPDCTLLWATATSTLVNTENSSLQSLGKSNQGAECVSGEFKDVLDKQGIGEANGNTLNTSSCLSRRPSLARGENNKTWGSFLVLLFTILEYPSFNEVIHWDGTNRVVLERPQILESYILMPVFGLPTLDIFKRRLYVFGFDCVSHRGSGPNAHPETSTWEHFTMTRLNPPMGFTNRDWSEEIGTDKPTPEVPIEPEAVLQEELRFRGPVPIPASIDGSKILDWSRPTESEGLAHASIYLNPIVHYEKKLACIRLSAKPKSREAASKVAEHLQRRYDLLFLRLETPKPVRLTATVRWGISNLKIPAHAWKSPVPTQVIEDYLANEPDDRPASPVAKDWAQVVNEFISRCKHLDETKEPELRLFSPNDRLRAHFRTPSRTSSVSEGHVSPEDDGPSEKVLHDN